MKFVAKELVETADVSQGETHWHDKLKLFLTVSAAIVLAYFGLGALAQVTATHISPEMEVQLFRWIDPPEEWGIESWTADAPGRDSFSESFQRTQSIFEGLLAQGDLRPLPYSLHLVQLEDPNAFAMPGGNVVVTSGLLEALTDDVSLAMVLAHELGHQQHRHVLERMGRSLLLSVCMNVLLGSAGGSGLVESSVQLAEAGHSRDQEREADAFGLTLVHGVYGSTEGAVGFFEHLLERSKDEGGMESWGILLASHPATPARIADLRTLAEQLDAGAQPGR